MYRIQRLGVYSPESEEIKLDLIHFIGQVSAGKEFNEIPKVLIFFRRKFKLKYKFTLSTFLFNIRYCSNYKYDFQFAFKP